jgi:hypothetical protein
VYALTKSSLVERDADLFQRVASCSRAIVAMSFLTVDDRLSRELEPGSTPRLRAHRRDFGPTAGIRWLMPKDAGHQRPGTSRYRVVSQ